MRRCLRWCSSSFLPTTCGAGCSAGCNQVEQRRRDNNTTQHHSTKLACGMGALPELVQVTAGGQEITGWLRPLKSGNVNGERPSHSPCRSPAAIRSGTAAEPHLERGQASKRPTPLAHPVHCRQWARGKRGHGSAGTRRTWQHAQKTGAASQQARARSKEPSNMVHSGMVLTTLWHSLSLTRHAATQLPNSAPHPFPLHVE